MNRAIKRAIGLGICALGLSALGLAMPPKPQESLPTVKDDPVASIPYAHRINTWEPLDTRHVLVSIDSQDRYLLTLREICPGLNYARSVGVTMSNNTIWAGFDAITTDFMLCEIKRINRVEHTPH